MRILVIDGYETSRIAMARVLRTAGHEASCAESIFVARERLEAGERLDIIVTGVEFQDCNAWDEMPELIQRFGVKVIAATGLGEARHRQRSERCGFSAHLIKPVDPTELLATVDRVGRVLPS